MEPCVIETLHWVSIGNDINKHLRKMIYDFKPLALSLVHLVPELCESGELMKRTMKISIALLVL